MPLDLHHAAIGSSRRTGIGKFLLRDNLRAEPLGRPAQSVGKQPVTFMRTINQRPAPPLFPDQILRQPVCQHAARRCRMKDVCAAILFPQPVVRGADIEDDYSFGLGCIRQRQKLPCGKICKNCRDPLAHHRVENGKHV
ncbi:hypothetical protein D3C71_656720 [compost metagenome]